MLRAKLGLAEARDDDQALAEDLLKLMAAARADHTITFRRLGRFATAAGADHAVIRDLFIDRAAFDGWATRYAQRLAREPGTDAERTVRMDRVYPKFVLRNHLAEVAIQAAQGGDFSATERLLQVLQRPYDEQDDAATTAYAGFPPEWAQSIEVSCSS
jgi:uncharacterized protein YdiU (UPF0061 family)